MKKDIGTVDKAKDYYLKKGEVVIPAREAKKIKRAISRRTRRVGGRNA